MKLALVLLWLIHCLPMCLISALAWALTPLAYLCAAGRRRVGSINLGLCFPDVTTAKRQRLLFKHFYYMVRFFLEYGVLCWGSAKRLQDLVTIHHLHYVTDRCERGQNVIVFYPHFVGLEMGVAALNQFLPLVSVYSQQKNTVLNTWLYRARNRFGNVFIFSRQAGIRPVIRAMWKNRAPFLYLADQDYGPRDSIFVKFFGVEAATITGLSRISALADAVVVPAVARRVGSRCELVFYPPWDNFPTDDVYKDTQRMNTFLEARIREMPEQYFWLHKRFKTRPPGEKKRY